MLTVLGIAAIVIGAGVGIKTWFNWRAGRNKEALEHLRADVKAARKTDERNKEIREEHYKETQDRHKRGRDGITDWLRNERHK